jgi:hypothetical protein
MTLQMVKLWHRTDTIPRLRGPSLEIWREKDNNNPAPSYEEFEDGSVQFYNGVNGRPCRNLCEFEKDLLKEFYLQCNIPEGVPYARFQLPDSHWQIPGTQFQDPGGAQFHSPDAPLEIPSFVELEIWRQKLNTPGLVAWEAFVKARQTKAQKEERNASIKAWMKLMHDMFWHKERHCRCKGKRKGISSRDLTTPQEKFQEMVKDMVFGVKWAILKMKFETLPKNAPGEEAFITGPESEQQDIRYSYIEEPNASTNKLSEENDPFGSPSEPIETQLRAIEDEKLWKIFKIAEKRIKWPRNTAELHVWGGAEAELRKSILDSGHTEFLKNVSRKGSYVHDSELTEDEIKLLNAQYKPPTPVKPPRTPRRYRRKPKKDAATRAAESKAAKARKHSFIKFFLKNPQMNKAAEDEYINNLVQKTPRKRYAPRRTTNTKVDNSDPWAAQEEFIKRILERSSRNKKEAKGQVHIPNPEVAEDNDIEDSPSKKISIHLTIKKPGDEQIQQQVNDEVLHAPAKKSTSRKRKSPQKPAGAENGNGGGDEEMMASPAKKPRVRTPKTPKTAIATLDNPANAQNNNREVFKDIIAMTQNHSKNEPGCSDLAIQSMSDQILDCVDRMDPALLSTPAQDAPNQTTVIPMNAEAPETPSMDATDDTPSKLLILAELAIKKHGNQMMTAPAMTPKTPAKRKSRAKKPAQTPNEAALEDTPSKQLNISSMTIEGNEKMIVAPVKAPKTPTKRKSRAKKPAATPTHNDFIGTPETRNISAKTPIKNNTNNTPSQQLKLGSMTAAAQKNEEMMDATAKAFTTPAPRKNAVTATSTPKKRKSPVKKGAVDESPIKKAKTAHTKENIGGFDEFYNLIDPLLR